MSRALLFLGKSQEAKAIKVHLQLHVRFDPLNLVYPMGRGCMITVSEVRSGEKSRYARTIDN